MMPGVYSPTNALLKMKVLCNLVVIKGVLKSMTYLNTLKLN